MTPRAPARTAAGLMVGLGLVALAASAVGGWVGGGGAAGAVAVPPTPLGLAVDLVRVAADVLGAVSAGLALLPALTAAGPGRAPGRHAPGQGQRAPRSPPRDRRAALARAARFAVPLAAGWAGTALLALWLRAADARGVGAFTVSPAVLGAYAGEVADGRGLLLSLGCALLVAALWLAGRRSPRAPELALGVALLGVLPGPVTGHAAEHSGRGLAVPLLALHVAAASLWVGGLLAIVLVLPGRRRLTGHVLSRFSVLAGCCAAAVAVTGVLSAALRLPSPAALVGTGYGVLLLAKAAGLLGLVGLGWRARRVLLPRVGAQQRAASLTGWLSAELVLMSVVFGLAAALAGSAPG